MKVIRSLPGADIHREIEHRFTAFNQRVPSSKGRRYPRELVDLVCQAAAGGTRPAELSRLTGAATSVVSGWIKAARPSAAPRRLEVVKSHGAATAEAKPVATPIVVRLPSGIVVEFFDSEALTATLLTRLSRLEVAHAASR